jgi:ribosomal protein L7/L12
MIRFGMCVHFALLGSGATKPSLDAATAEHDVALASIRQAVRQGPCSAPRIVAIKKYRELAGSTLEEAKAWVDENPASYDLRIRLPNEA